MLNVRLLLKTDDAKECLDLLVPSVVTDEQLMRLGVWVRLHLASVDVSQEWTGPQEPESMPVQ